MTYYLHHSLAQSTRASYSSAQRCFINFALTYNSLNTTGSPIPASENTLMLFATYLTHTHKPQSIKLYLSAVRTLHLEHGLSDPTSEAVNLRRLMRGIKRVHGNTTDSRLPITPSLLRSFRSFLNLSYPDHLTLWAAILLAFFAFLRSGELLSLHRSDLHRTVNGYQAHIKQSKTDPFHSGAVVTVLPSGDPSLCAVTALDSYLATQGPTERTLFRLQTAALTRQRFNHLIRDLASRCGVESQRYSSHSFRIGAAAGIPDWRIQAQGRWSSDCYRCYIRLPSSETNGITAALAGAPL